jgi:phosphoribosyl 1,2-cyclic phosphodiesterase
MAFKAKLWGVRGSIPAPLPPSEIDRRLRTALQQCAEQGFDKHDINKYIASLPLHKRGGFGGNTPCCEVFTESTMLLIDGGSGLRRKACELMQGPCGRGEGELHILMTHFHWDHIIGIPFFMPVFIPGNRIHIYSVQEEAENSLRILFRKPNFPVPYEALGAEIVYHRLEPRTPRTVGDIRFTPYLLDHPDPAWGYRLESEGRVLSYCVDTECRRASRDELGEDLPLYRNVNTLIIDAQYSLPEAIEKVNWGHAAATIALDIAMREKIDTVIFTHHDPAAGDEKIAVISKQTEDYAAHELNQARKAGVELHKVAWRFAQEEMAVTI